MPKVELSPEDEMNLKNELDWTITQLQLNLQKCKKAADAERISKLINMLGQFEQIMHILTVSRKHENTGSEKESNNEARIPRLQKSHEERSRQVGKRNCQV